MALAATISTGGNWPAGTRATTGSVIIWSGEDDPADTLLPRLMAAGADLGRVHIVDGVTDGDGSRAFDPATDMPVLLTAAHTVGDVRLLIVDPVISAVQGDSHKNAETRRALQPLVDFGRDTGAAVLGISHFSKGTSCRDPLERLSGSLAFGALARLVFGAAVKKTDEEKVMKRFFTLFLLLLMTAEAGAVCTVASVKGRYAYLLTGSSASAFFCAQTGTTYFDGLGLVSGSGVQSCDGTSAFVSETGMYIVNPDCTGSIAFPSGATYYFSLYADRRAAHFIATTPGVTAAGTAAK